MATPQQIKEYLACWLQLGKAVCLDHQSEPRKLLQIVQGDHYSPEFEALWNQILTHDPENCYLDGSDASIAELLRENWDIIDCARCQMPVSLPKAGVASPLCPCHDLPNWPNTELPQPRIPVESNQHLQSIYQRLREPMPSAIQTGP
ncbi:MAG: hypothetical protein HC934_03430 [Acaryochloridaceae cyanobacterium SU_2_1]|nr:hypothetical protein [Acaryochloridaceae cyanobacterium SU_2_1]NJM95733.1 hypothetical protein [Acaryochloridaceae cyanobacterium CSU_5_19]